MDGHYNAMKGLNKKQTLIVNIFGGPGSGKSIVCANVFSELKWNHYSAEMALEYVKDEVWEENYNAISNQLFIFGNQHQRIHRLMDKVDIIIVDSPLLLSFLYDKENNVNFRNFVLDKFNSYRNINFFIKRCEEEYEYKGRMHNLDQAKKIDKKIFDILNNNNIDYHTVEMKDGIVNNVYEKIVKEL